MTRRLTLLFFSTFLLLHSIADAAVLRGTVTDPDGRPVPGARVVVTGSRPGTFEVDTNAQGEFETADLAAGAYAVRVVLDGFIADPRSIDVRDGAVPPLAISLRVSAMAESVLVSAAQADLPLSQSASTVTVLSGADLDARQMRTVGDALSFVPGLSVARNGSAGSLTSLFTRGGESDFTLVLLDGMRLNTFGGAVDLSQLPLVDVDRIEIVRGPQSAVFGSDAIGGVVQIVSRRAARDHADALLEGGSLGSLRLRAAAGGGSSHWNWRAAVEHAQTDGFTGTAPATGTPVVNDDGKANHAGFDGGWRAASGTDVRATSQFSFTEKGFPGAYGSNPIGAYTEIDKISRGTNDRRQFGLDWTQPWGGPASRVRQRTSVTFADFDSDFVSPFGPSTSSSRRISFRSQADAAINSTLGVSAGLEVQRERADSTFITGTTAEEIPIERWLDGYFAEARLAPAARLSLAAGVRLERIGRDPLEADPFAFQPRPAMPQNTVVSINPKVSLAYMLHDSTQGGSTRVRVSAGTGIRPPDAFEIAFTDNPGLKPERSRSVDFGVQQTVAGGMAVAEVTAFFNTYDDLIVSVGTSFRDASQFRTDNISNARSRGLELALGARPTSRVNIRGSYTFLDTEILSIDRANGQAPSPYVVGEALIRRPRHQGSINATFADRRLTGFVNARFRGKVRDVEPSFGAFGGVFTADGYGVVDLGASVRVTRMFEAFARVENVGGRSYEEAFGFPAPGAVTIVGIRFAASR